MAAQQWSFSGYSFPYEDSPTRGNSGDWNWEEKLIEHDPLMANVTILTSWGRKSARRTITGTCGQTTRDTLRQKHQDAEVGALVDGEGRSVQARIVRADFKTVLPVGVAAAKRYDYTIEFMER